MTIEMNSILPTILESASNTPALAFLALGAVGTNYHRVFRSGARNKLGGGLFSTLMILGGMLAGGSFGVSWFTTILAVLGINAVSHLKFAHEWDKEQHSNESAIPAVIGLSVILGLITSFGSSHADDTIRAEALQAHAATYGERVEADGVYTDHLAVFWVGASDRHDSEYCVACYDQSGHYHEIHIDDDEEDKVAILRDVRRQLNEAPDSMLVLKVSMTQDRRAIDEKFAYDSMELVD